MQPVPPCVRATTIRETEGFDFPPTKNWRSHFFGCLSNIYPSCILSFCCPLVLAFQISHKLGLRSECTATHTVTMIIWSVVIIYPLMFCFFYLNKTALIFSGFICCWLFFCFCIWTIRQSVRAKFDIPGIMQKDCVLACCCLPCTLSQAARHVYGYRSIGNCNEYSFTLHGTPSWQIELRESIVTTIAQVHDLPEANCTIIFTESERSFDEEENKVGKEEMSMITATEAPTMDLLLSLFFESNHSSIYPPVSFQVHTNQIVPAEETMESV